MANLGDSTDVIQAFLYFSRILHLYHFSSSFFHSQFLCLESVRIFGNLFKRVQQISANIEISFRLINIKTGIVRIYKLNFLLILNVCATLCQKSTTDIYFLFIFQRNLFGLMQLNKKKTIFQLLCIELSENFIKYL